jgi:type I restriction enzyme M protein
MDAAEYKHIVLGLVFIKYISDSFAERREELETSFSNPKSDNYKSDEKRRAAALEDRNYYKEVNVFWVPENARWQTIADNSKQPEIKKLVDEALFSIEKENPRLEGILERIYSDSKIPPHVLGEVVDLIGTINFGNKESTSSDILGATYEYFLGMFADKEGKRGGQYFTAPSIVKTLVEVLQPTNGRVYDPACGSGGMFVQSEKFVESHGGVKGNIAIYGQESNPTNRRLCAMNLAIRGIEFDLGSKAWDTFDEDLHKDKKFDYIMMNPPFGNDASYPKEKTINDVRWKTFGVPREKPANYAWMSHALFHLAPKGRAGIVMARGSLTSANKEDLAIRRGFIEAGVVECIIDLPSNLFFNTPIPSCIWFFNKDKKQWKNSRGGEILFIDARKMGHPISRSQIEFSQEEISKIAQTFIDWTKGRFEDIPEFAVSVPESEVLRNRLSLSPGRYLGLNENDDEEFDVDYQERISTLVQAIKENIAEASDMDSVILDQIEKLSHGN